MRSRSRPGLRRSQAIWECPNRGPSGPVFLGKSQTWTGTAGFGLVQTGFQSVWDRTSPTLVRLTTSFPVSPQIIFHAYEPGGSWCPIEEVLTRRKRRRVCGGMMKQAKETSMMQARTTFLGTMQLSLMPATQPSRMCVVQLPGSS